MTIALIDKYDIENKPSLGDNCIKRKVLQKSNIGHFCALFMNYDIYKYIWNENIPSIFLSYLITNRFYIGYFLSELLLCFYSTILGNSGVFMMKNIKMILSLTIMNIVLFKVL